MGVTSKNLGQVSGIHIGTTPPDNINLIWYDSTPSQVCHKLFDNNLNDWVILKQEIISNITYQEITGIATTVGLSIGKFYILSDKGSVLAMAITTTKIKYCDLVGNILIDDLGTNVQYHVTSNNLIFDIFAGTWNDDDKVLAFNFSEYVPLFTDDYIYGRAKRSNVWHAAKYKLSSLLSTVSGNSISWSGGFFFNFQAAIRSISDNTGGIVSKSVFDQSIDELSQDVENVASNYQALIESTEQSIITATSSDAIYGKELPSLDITPAATDAAVSDTLLLVVAKFQRWINQFKTADGINVSIDFADASTPSYINNNDTVDSALRKVQAYVKNIVSHFIIPNPFVPSSVSSPIADISTGDDMIDAFKKVQGKFNQIGNLEDGKISSKQLVDSPSSTQPRTVVNLKTGDVEFYSDLTSPTTEEVDATFGRFGIDLVKDSKHVLKVSGEGTMLDVPTLIPFDVMTYEADGVPNTKGAAGLFVQGTANELPLPNSTKLYTAIAGKCDVDSLFSNDGNVFGGYFDQLKACGLTIGTIATSTLGSPDVYLDNLKSHLVCRNSSSLNVYMPPVPHKGQIVFIKQDTTNSVTIYGNGNSIRANENNVSSFTMAGGGYLAILIYDGYNWSYNSQGLP